MSETTAAAAKLTLGPILFNWAAEEKRDFYLRIADEAPFDAVCLGEVVCSKRSVFFEPYLAEVTRRLERAGKTVVRSTLALIMSERDFDEVRAVAAAPNLLVEANDISCAALLAGRAHTIGPLVNVYNEGTLDYLRRGGAVRVSLPAELPARSVSALCRAGTGVELEVQAFGRLPLAISARCYHARSYDLHKDGCQYVCGNDADGMVLETMDEVPFLAVNGTQTLSYTVCNLIRELGELAEMGVGSFRLWPQALDMVAVARIFRDVLDGKEDGERASVQLDERVDIAPFSNGFYHGREGALWLAAEAEAGGGAA